jgi:hypothetical protein
MITSLTRTPMGWLCAVTMVLNDVSICVSSPMPLIILRSESVLLFQAAFRLIDFRVLLATIRDQGLCPCLCCLVPDTQLDQLGLIADMKNRIKKYYVYQANSVNKARDAIYNFRDPVNGSRVQRLLRATSAVPTSVSC